MNDNTKTQPLSTDPYKGVRDFYPEDMFIENYIFSTWKKTLEGFGYNEYNASILEPTDLYRSKTSEEIVNEQTYSFKDRGERDVTLRPEMTPTAARMVAARRRELGFPLRWYSIPNVFRYEQPQRGRLREHWQLNADIFGSHSVDADIELISLAYHIMKAFGAKDEDFVIKINDRGSIMKGLRELQTTPEQERSMMRLLDKKDKIPEETYKNEVRKILGEVIKIEFEKSENIEKIIAALEEQSVKNVQFSETITRGFDYYTGMVFEVFDTNPENKRSLFGGGRYDNLTANFGGDPIPAVGFGMGDVTIRDFLETHNLLPIYTSSVHLFIATVGDVFTVAEKLAQELREKGLNVAVNVSDKKLGDQIKLADKQKIPFVLTIGEDEVKNKTYTVKELASGKETKCSGVDEIVKVIK